LQTKLSDLQNDHKKDIGHLNSEKEKLKNKHKALSDEKSEMAKELQQYKNEFGALNQKFGYIY